MAEPLSRGPVADVATQRSGLEPLPRCCPNHDSWPLLSQHLLEEFPDVAVADLVREVRRAKDAVAAAGLDGPDALATGELIARHQLMLLAGHVSDIARLDPERHVRDR